MCGGGPLSGSLVKARFVLLAMVVAAALGLGFGGRGVEESRDTAVAESAGAAARSEHRSAASADRIAARRFGIGGSMGQGARGAAVRVVWKTRGRGCAGSAQRRSSRSGPILNFRPAGEAVKSMVSPTVRERGQSRVGQSEEIGLDQAGSRTARRTGLTTCATERPVKCRT